MGSFTGNVGSFAVNQHGNSICKVVPQFVNAKLVQITAISLWFMVDVSVLSIVTLVYEPTDNWGGTTVWIYDISCR